MFTQIKGFLKSSFAPLCLLILIDHMGIGIIFPILVPIFMDPSEGILGPQTSDLIRNLWYGVTLSAYPLALFFAASVIGDLSDHFGRKRVLSWCIILAVLGYLLSAIAVDIGSLSLLIFSRIIDGVAAGSMPIAQAAAIDMSTESERTSRLSIVILMASCGFLIGPLVGGFLSNKATFPWSSFSTPLYFASMISAVNLILLKLYFKETFVPKKTMGFSLSRSLYMLRIPFQMASIRTIAIIFLAMQLAWSAFFQFIPIFLTKKQNFSTQDISFFLSLVGVGFAVGSFYVIKLFTRYFSDSLSGIISLFFATLGVLICMMDLHISLTWGSSILLGVMISIAYAILIKLFSSTVSDQRQGWIMGISESIAAIAWAVTPLLSAYLSNVNLYVPLILAITLFLISTIGLSLWQPTNVIAEIPEGY